MINLDKITHTIAFEVNKSMEPMLDRLDRIIDLLEEIRDLEKAS